MPEPAADARWMREALALLTPAACYVPDPNPRVACLIVRDGQVLGAGVTQKAGGPHAEVMALRQAAAGSRSLAGSTVYVTLEPCSHHGRTPPCADALVAAAPARVVVAMRDPNPRVAGGGVARLRAAGIEVSVGCEAEAALAFNPGFVARMTRGTPWLWLKLAGSLDGRTALPSGESQWITGREARADGHHLRALSSVVLTGMGTLRRDDPQLTVRAVETARPPVRAVIDNRYELPEDARLLDGGRVWVFTCRGDPAKAERLARRGAETIVLPDDGQGRVSLPALMQWLGAHEVNDVHVEAGARLNGGLLAAGCVDELFYYQAPLLLGDGPGLAALPALTGLAEATRYDLADARRVGDDLRLQLRRPDRWQALRDAVA